MKRLLPAALLVAAVALWSVGLYLGLTRPPNVDPYSLIDVAWGVGFLFFPLVGFVIARKRPENTVGWMFMIWPGLVLVGGVLTEVVNHRQAQASPWVAYAADGLFFLGLGVMAGFFLGLFPTGRFLPGKWRLLGWAGATGATLTVLWGFTRSCTTFVLALPVPEPDSGPGCTDPLEPWFLRFENPIPGLPDADALWGAIGAIGAVLGFIAMFGGAVQLFARYRTGGPVERAQLRWLVLVLAVVTPLILVLIVSDLLGVDLPLLSAVAFFVLLVAIPLAIGMAILRYRLFDIDRIISRTVSYGIVIGILFVVFAVGVVLLPTLLSIDDSSFLVAASTLAVAAMFNPLRRRVQRTVDRRFNRTRYDLATVTERFGAELRDSVEPAGIVSEWTRVVTETLQPVTLGSWVRNR